MELNNIFSKLWNIYTSQNPVVQRVYDLFTSKGEKVVNDHIAFRTFNHPKINIDKLSEIFINNGYKYIDSYHFTEKKLFAKHFEHITNTKMPRIFISELILENFSEEFLNTINTFIESIPEETLNYDNIIYAGRLWDKPSYHTYEKLKMESEYAAWLYYNGFCANHFTVSVNHLQKLDALEKVNDLIKENGFKINSSGGEIKGTPAELLEQSSIMSEIFEGDFIEGRYPITGCYYEFARRYNDENGNLYSGFIAKSADKIFESTDMKK